MNDIQHNPDHWRALAEKARARARTLHDPEFIRELMAIAISYDRLAERAEDNAARKSKASG